MIWIFVTFSCCQKNKTLFRGHYLGIAKDMQHYTTNQTKAVSVENFQ